MDLRFKWGRAVEQRGNSMDKKAASWAKQRGNKRGRKAARRKGGAEYRQEQRAENWRAILAPVLTSDKMFHFSGLTS